MPVFGLASPVVGLTTESTAILAAGAGPKFTLGESKASPVFPQNPRCPGDPHACPCRAVQEMQRAGLEPDAFTCSILAAGAQTDRCLRIFASRAVLLGLQSWASEVVLRFPFLMHFPSHDVACTFCKHASSREDCDTLRRRRTWTKSWS